RAEHLRSGLQLHVDFQPDDRLPVQRASSVASARRSRCRAASIMRPSSKWGAISCPPIGKPFDRPMGTDIAGTCARFAVQTNRSARYIETGSSTFSPALKAGVGVVGVKRRSTPPGLEGLRNTR